MPPRGRSRQLARYHGLVAVRAQPRADVARLRLRRRSAGGRFNARPRSVRGEAVEQSPRQRRGGPDGAPAPPPASSTTPALPRPRRSAHSRFRARAPAAMRGPRAARRATPRTPSPVATLIRASTGRGSSGNSAWRSVLVKTDHVRLGELAENGPANGGPRLPRAGGAGWVHQHRERSQAEARAVPLLQRLEDGGRYIGATSHRLCQDHIGGRPAAPRRGGNRRSGSRNSRRRPLRWGNQKTAGHAGIYQLAALVVGHQAHPHAPRAQQFARGKQQPRLSSSQKPAHHGQHRKFSHTATHGNSLPAVTASLRAQRATNPRPLAAREHYTCAAARTEAPPRVILIRQAERRGHYGKTRFSENGGGRRSSGRAGAARGQRPHRRRRRRRAARAASTC